MSEASSRDFSSFLLDDNVYELCDHLIPVIADEIGVPIGAEPNSQDLQAIVTKIGPDKVLRDNPELDEVDKDTIVTFVDRSGIQTALNRSLWTPELIASSENVDAVIVMGGIANWMDRSNAIIPQELMGKPIYYVAGTRVMDRPTEITNLNIQRFNEKFKRYPEESEYAASVVIPELKKAGHDVLLSSFDSNDGDTILHNFFQENPDLLDQQIAVARVANAGILMAIQVRNAAKKLQAGFDLRTDPQLFVTTDSFPLARTEKEENNPRSYQKAASALRNMVLTGKLLFETEGE